MNTAHAAASSEETQQRMIAALRGAHLAAHVPMKANKKVKKGKPKKKLGK